MHQSAEERLNLYRSERLSAEPPPYFRLTNSEATIFGVLMNNRARPDALMNALFSTNADDAPDERILDVWMCKMLKPFGIEIKTHRGDCWEIPEKSKVIARELMKFPS